jgi:hypothetical protein
MSFPHAPNSVRERNESVRARQSQTRSRARFRVDFTHELTAVHLIATHTARPINGRSLKATHAAFSINGRSLTAATRPPLLN